MRNEASLPFVELGFARGAAHVGAPCGHMFLCGCFPNGDNVKDAGGLALRHKVGDGYDVHPVGPVVCIVGDRHMEGSWLPSHGEMVVD